MTIQTDGRFYFAREVVLPWHAERGVGRVAESRQWRIKRGKSGCRGQNSASKARLHRFGYRKRVSPSAPAILRVLY